MMFGLSHNKSPEKQAALILSALGNAHRLRIYRLLVRAGPAGVSVGGVQRHVGIPASTLSHHIAALKEVDLITQHRAGRTIFSCANYDLMDGLLAYLTDECCVDS